MEQRQQQLIFQEQCYKVISIERGYLIHPSVLFRDEPIEEFLSEEFQAIYRINDNQLIIEELSTNTGSVPVRQKMLSLRGVRLRYSGAVLIGKDPIREYPLQENSLPCYSYRIVYELVFNHGVLVTTADQSRAMLRIRRNLELGYRSLMVKRDMSCIHKFMNSSFIGDYRPLSERKKRKILEEMKNLYLDKEK